MSILLKHNQDEWLSSRYFPLQTDLGGESVIVVAGGLDARNTAVSEVEFLNIENGKVWNTLGRLNHPVQNFPTVGRVLGEL